MTTVQAMITYGTAGLAFFYGVSKFFKEVEDRLTDDTKLGIAVWLVSLETQPRLVSWAHAFATVFDRVFGARHFSWRCFGRSCLATYCSIVLITLVWGAIDPPQFVRWASGLSVGDAIFLSVLFFVFN